MFRQRFLRILVEACRLLTGAVFVFSGFVKAVDPSGFAIKIGDYLAAFHLDSLDFLALPVALFLIALEFTLGVCTLLGVYRKWASRCLLLFMLVMTPLTFYLALFNPVSDCGCFGDALILTNWETFGKNIVLSCMAILLAVCYRLPLSFYTPKTRWFIPVFAFAYTLGFAVWNYRHLPLLDFRPYKIGTNIPAAMRIPEGAPEDEYRYSFIYEKDGVKKSFSLENSPVNDSTWTFVDTQTKLLKKGYTPPIASFDIFNPEGKNLSDSLLRLPELLLLVAPKLETADDRHIDGIADIYEYAQTHHIPFYCLTGSAPAQFEKWRERTGATYRFLEADETLLKTVIRANPGLLWLQRGTLRMKWSGNDLPNETRLTAFLQGELAPPQGKPWIYINLFGFALPLLLVWVYDFFRFRRKDEKPAEKQENVSQSI
ncbi:MAG: DoxX family protein [Tannerella sp.]|jgi:uncharacterized membrane protein YphA (DoxX/SURF4 family)|nr:DoxX family protein [Tannerella sp.]